MNTVNVIEQNNEGEISSLRAFRETPAGNKKAEKLFKQCAKENGAEKNQLDFYCENGFYSCGSYTVFLVHSSN